MAPDVVRVRSSPTWKPTRKDGIVFAILSIASFVTALDSTVLVTILPVIAKELHGSTSDSFWAGTSYLLSSAVSQPIVAGLAELFGTRALLWHSILLFTVGSMVCGLATRFPTLLAGRSIQGVGGGGSITLVQRTFARLNIPLRERPKWFSLILLIWAIGSVVGPFVGSGLTARASYHWVFWINLPICGIILVLVPFFIDATHPPISFWGSLSRVDWVGGAFFIVGTTSLLVGLSWGGLNFSWTSAWTLCPIIVGCFGILSTAVWERSFAAYPFLSDSVFHNRSIVVGYMSAFLHGLILLCALYYLPFYFAWALWSGWIVAILGSGLLLLLDVSTSSYVWITIFLVFGLGNGFLLSAVNFSVQASAGVAKAGQAASMYTSCRSLGMGVGVAIGSNVFENRMAHQLQQVGLPTLIARNAEAYVYILHSMDVADPTTQAILQAYVHGFRGVFWTLLAASAAGLMLGFAIKSYRTETLDEVLLNGLASVRPGEMLVKLVDTVDNVDAVGLEAVTDALEVNEGRAPSVEDRFKELVETPVAIGAIEGEVELSPDAVGNIPHGRFVPG
ncbi:hypothetical protein H2200_013615 [Cladophialophora chaetospira]|uniref:Major facilitator superfamily (MFS) profile domain-containing protein n=1 Tax=Cladophialophora chaetospira TaxID=386627 RepID=A0AA38WUE5_9EURO|nr:hypothetical protein H2200_013615 [Cladophialophora chaetospira]